MANDWIKMRTDLYRDPKVIVMADSMLDPDGELASFIEHNCRRNMTVTRNVTRNACVGALLSVWGVMRHRGVRVGDDLECHGITLAVVDDIADLPGFGKAMQHVGWIENSESGLIFPRFFADYNVEPDEKNKSKNAERQARYREKLKAKSNVTSNVTRNVTVTPREEKRREEKKDISHPCENPSDAGSNILIPKELADLWPKWTQHHFIKTGQPIGEPQQEAILLDLAKRGWEKARADILFSMRIGASTVRDSENDFDKNAKKSASSKPEPKKEKELPMITELPPEIVAIYTRQAEERRKRNAEFERKRHDESMRGSVNLRDPNKAV